MTSNNIASDSQSIKNIYFIWLNRIFLILTPIVVTPIITNFFGLEIAGIWFFISVFSSQLLLLEIGISTSLIRLLARPENFQSRRNTINIIVTSLYLLIFISLILAISAPWITTFLLKTFNFPDIVMLDAKYLTYISIFSVAINIPLRIGYSIFASRHMFDIVQKIDIAGILLRLLSIVFMFTFLSPTIFLLGCIVFGISVGISLITFIKAINLLKLQVNHFYLSSFSFEAFKLLISMTGASFFVTLSAIILLQFSSTLVGYFLNFTFVSLMAIPLMIFNSITPFFQAIPTIASPIAAGISNEQEKNKLYKDFYTYSRYTSSIAFIVLIGLLTAGKPLLFIWLGGDSVDISDIGIMLQILIIVFTSYSLSFVGAIGRSILLSIGYHWHTGISELISSILGIFLGTCLLIYMDAGVLGMSLGIGSAMVVRGFIIYPLLLSKYFNVSLIDIHKRTILRPFFAFLILIIFMNLFDSISIFSSSHLIYELIEFTIILMPWIVFNFYFILTNDHKKQIKLYFENKINH